MTFKILNACKKIYPKKNIEYFMSQFGYKKI